MPPIFQLTGSHTPSLLLQKASRSCCTSNIAHLLLTTDALLESSSASVIVCLTCAQAKIPSMLAVDGHVTRAQVQYMSSSKQSVFFTLLLVTHAQAEAAERLKEMVLEDAKRADSCAPQLLCLFVGFGARLHISPLVATALATPAHCISHAQLQTRRLD